MSSTAHALWKRRCQVVIGKAGTGTEVADPLRIVCKITKTLDRTPNPALIKIYNLSPATEGLIKGEYNEVLVNAGYQNDLLLVFRGNIRHVFSYRDNTERIVEIDAADGDLDFRKSIVNVSLAAGASQAELISRVLGSFTDTVKGHLGIPDRTHIRGRIFSGNARDLLDDIAGWHDANWSIQDGALQIVTADSTLPTDAIVVNSDTGMLGAPEIDDKGIRVRVLFNPRHKVNGKIQLNNNDVMLRVRHQRASAPGASHPSKQKAQGQVARLDPDGIYKVYKLEHNFDTRGQAHTELYCVGLDKAIPAGKVAA